MQSDWRFCEMCVKELLGAVVAVHELCGRTARCAGEVSVPRPCGCIVPFAPGGGADISARTIAAKLTERFGQQVVVDNRPGAGGNVGTELASKAPPDGYTLLLVSSSYGANPSALQALVRPGERLRADHAREPAAFHPRRASFAAGAHR